MASFYLYIFISIVLLRKCVLHFPPPPDPGTPYHHEFQFQPPLPPGSPCFASPPPLPHGTPPATPTPPPLPKGTPPPTPTNGSPALRGQNWVVVDEMAEGTEDDLTLEELEEQQRLIWAALENAETTNSDSGTPALGTPVPSSPGASTPVHVDTEAEEAMNTTTAEEAMKTVESSEGSTNVLLQESQLHDTYSEEPGPVKVEDDSPQSPEPVKSQENTPQSTGPVKVKEDSPQSPDASQQGSSLIILPVDREETPQSPDPNLENVEDLPQQVTKVTSVPHRTNFAAGIVQFEDTPEFTEVAAATGTYLKIRDLLKSSPRSLAKKKV